MTPHRFALAIRWLRVTTDYFCAAAIATGTVGLLMIGVEYWPRAVWP